MEYGRRDMGPEYYLSVAQYALELFSPGHRISVSNLSEIRSYLLQDLQEKSRMRLKCVPIPDNLTESLISDCLEDNEEVFDANRCAIVGSKAAISLGLPVDGSRWCIVNPCNCSVTNSAVCTFHCSTSENNKNYTLQVVSNRYVSDNHIIFSETVYNNIRKYFLTNSTSQEEELFLRLRRCDSIFKTQEGRFAPKYAEKAVVCWVKEPVEASEDLITACLSNYFETPRHLHEGDLFRVDLRAYTPDALFLPMYHNLHHLYFLVKQLEGPNYEEQEISNNGYFVVKEETTLLQASHVQSRIPSSIYMLPISQQNYSFKNFENILQLRCPSGLLALKNQMIACFQPFIEKKKQLSLKPLFLLSGPVGSGKRALLSSIASYQGLHLWPMDCAELQGITSGQTEGKLRAIFSKAKQFAPCLFVLDNIEILSKDKDGHEDLRVISEFQDQLASLNDTEITVIIVATTSASSNLSGSLARMFLQEFTIPIMTERDRKNQLEWILKNYNLSADNECLQIVSTRCSGFLLADLDALVVQALRNKYTNLKCNINDLDRKHLSLANFEDAIEKVQSAYAGAIGAPKIPSVSWDDVGGLEDLKEEILRTVTMPLKHPELLSAGLRRSGILLFGPPGTGKTLIAKAVATECGLNFLSVKGPELLNMYVGQSEENVREVFERARSASPCIIFFDELDSLAPNRGRSGDSGGVMDRVVSQLLAEMDGVQKSTHLFVIGATNRPDLIDPALLRPGRFDKLLYVGACSDDKTKFSVLSALTRKFVLSSDVDFYNLVRELPPEVTGADLYSVCSGAWRGAVRRAINFARKEGGKVNSVVDVTQADFVKAISEMTPSVKKEDMDYFQSLRQQLSCAKST